MARKAGATDIINFAKEDVYERIKEISKGEGEQRPVCKWMGLIDSRRRDEPPRSRYPRRFGLVRRLNDCVRRGPAYWAGAGAGAGAGAISWCMW
jgi:hypothetical protein